MPIKRRSFLAAAAMLGVPPAAPGADPSSLRALAAAKGLLFGSEVLADELAGDPAYAALIARECAVVTPGIEAKFGIVEPEDGRFDFTRLDAIAGFCAAHDIALHMHNMIWGVFMRPWELAALAAGRGEAVLARHVAAVAGRYAGRVLAWDVVNEPVDPRWHAGPEGLTLTPWRRALGPGEVADAFRLTRNADPGALLMLNDDNLEYAAPDREQKRATYLHLIEGWLAAGVPIGGFGLEAHLKPDRPIDEAGLRRFLAALGGMGLQIWVTELDVEDRTLPADIGARDRAVADLTGRYLDLVLDEPAARAVITWGLSDRHSDLSTSATTRRADGLASRGLPYDDALAPKPMRDAIARAFRHAPASPSGTTLPALPMTCGISPLSLPITGTPQAIASTFRNAPARPSG